MTLPTQKTPPCNSMTDLSVLIYGASKIGKSTLCANADHALFLATEAGLNSLDVYQQPILTWQDMLTTCAEIGAGHHGFKTIVMDTVDNAYKMCADYICKKNNIQHESDMGFGKGFSLVNGEFLRVLTKLSLMPYGFYLISHAQDKEMDTPNGKRIKTIPTLPGKAREIVLGMVDIILFCDMEMVTGPDGKPTERRVMHTKPSVLYEAGDRTKRLPETIDLNFEAFVSAYKSGSPSTTPAPATATNATASPEGKVGTQAAKPGAQSAAQPAAQGGNAPHPIQAAASGATSPSATPTGPSAGDAGASSAVPSEEWTGLIADLAAVTLAAEMSQVSRQKLLDLWMAEDQSKPDELRKEIATIRGTIKDETVRESLDASQADALARKEAPGADAAVWADGIECDEKNGGISPEQYQALNTLIGAYGLNRDALRAYCEKAGHILPGKNGPTLARLKAEAFTKLRDRLMKKEVADRKTGETWSARTVRTINATAIPTQPLPLAS